MISLKAPIPFDFSVQNQVMYSNLPPPLDRQMQRAVSLLVYEASLGSSVLGALFEVNGFQYVGS
jgi:hypothetical protein